MLNLNINMCKGCKYCVKFCPKGILELGEERNKHGHFFPHITNEESCIACAICATVCPEAAIELTEKEDA